MAWNDELLEARYTSPSGKTFSFRWGDVSKETDLKTSAYTFPQKDGALVQSLGRGGRRFPLDCVFAGEDCFSDADAFESGLEEKGIGELQHPVYGTRKVVPTGSIKRADNLVSGANMVTITVTFSETITDEAMPNSSVAVSESILSDYEAIEDLAVSDFAGGIETANASEQIKLSEALKKNLNTSFKEMEGAAESLSLNDELYQAFMMLKKQGAELIEKLGKDINAPLNFARTLYNIYKLPSKQITSLRKTIDGYTGAYTSLLIDFTTDPMGAQNIANQFHALCLSLVANVTSLGSALTNVAGATDTSAETTEGEAEASGNKSVGFKNREEAINAISELNELFDNYTEYVDKYAQKNVFVDDSETYYAVQKLVVSVENYVLNIAFDLPTKRTITLGRDRQLLELLTELYGNLNHIDEFIQENNLNADELEVLPMGREVQYYVN